MSQHINTGFNFSFNQAGSSNSLGTTSSLASVSNPISSSLPSTSNTTGPASAMILSSIPKSFRSGLCNTQNKLPSSSSSLNPTMSSSLETQLFPKQLDSIGNSGDLIFDIIPVSEPPSSLLRTRDTPVTQQTSIGAGTSNSDMFNYNNQAFDYRISNKVTSFYNHQNSQPNNQILNQTTNQLIKHNPQKNMFSHHQKSLGNQIYNSTGKPVPIANKQLNQAQLTTINQLITINQLTKNEVGHDFTENKFTGSYQQDPISINRD